MPSTGNPALRIINRSWTCIWITFVVVLSLEALAMAFIPSPRSRTTFGIYFIIAGINLVLFFLCVRAMRLGSDHGLTWYKVLLWLGVLNSFFVFMSDLAAGAQSRLVGTVIAAVPLYVLPLYWLGDPNFAGGFNALRNPDWYTEPVNAVPQVPD